jgi:hypothetical protein
MTDAVDTKHPDYIAKGTVVAGHARHVGGRRGCQRGRGGVPAEASGFSAQADGGMALYAAYQERAQFPEIVRPTIHGMIGVIHRTEAQIEMPTAMEPLWEKATRDGLPLEALHRRITAELLTTGRYGLLADAAVNGSDLPFGLSPS